jgi:hypothetical protein
MHIIEGDPEQSFFDQNPEIRYISEVAKMIKKYGEKETGRMLWATYLLEDPHSKLYKIPHEEREQLVAENYIRGEFKIKDLEEIREAYPRLIMSKTQILYKGWADKIDEANAFVRRLKFETDGDKILTYLEKINKMWSSYEKIAEAMEKEENVNVEVRKGVKESLREKRG